MSKILLALTTMILFSLYTSLVGLVIYPVGLLKMITPVRSWRDNLRKLLNLAANFWISCNGFVAQYVLRTKLDIVGLEGFNPKKWYLVISNHFSATDVLVLSKIFNRKIPAPRFLIKSTLIWLPVVGQTCWFLDFPFLKRYSKKKLAKHPELRHKDLDKLRSICATFKNTPLSIMSYLEGTRYTKAKAEAQHSPYRRLLKPRVGGFAMMMSTIGKQFDAIADVTIAYPKGVASFWKLISGQIPKIKIHVQKIPVTKELLHHNPLDKEFRDRLQIYLNNLWETKDQTLERLLAE